MTLERLRGSSSLHPRTLEIGKSSQPVRTLEKRAQRHHSHARRGGHVDMAAVDMVAVDVAAR
jgi:hypothetical protein